MCRNVGGTDRITRTILGLCMVYGGIIFHEATSCALSIVGLILLFSGLRGWCPLYAIFGASTCTVPAKK